VERRREGRGKVVVGTDVQIVASSGLSTCFRLIPCFWLREKSSKGSKDPLLYFTHHWPPLAVDRDPKVCDEIGPFQGLLLTCLSPRVYRLFRAWRRFRCTRIERFKATRVRGVSLLRQPHIHVRPRAGDAHGSWATDDVDW
jgi:hypothetical protein